MRLARCLPFLPPPPPQAVLEVLRASGCNALRSVVIQLPPEAPLRTLQLDGCRQLAEVVVVAPRLEAANCSNCGQLKSVLLRCKCVEAAAAAAPLVADACLLAM